MSLDVEPPIIDYARFYGLAHDHRQLSPLQALTLPEYLGPFLDDPPGLVHIDLTSVKVPEERLAVDAGAASFLLSIADLAKHSPSLSDQDLGIDRHRVRRLKHELPLLRSDHELDVLRFASPIVPHLENEFLPLETVDVEEDEAFEWPSIYSALPDEFAKKSKSEKIEASKDDFLFLQQTLKLQFERVEHGAFEVDDLPYKRKAIPEPVSPPLLPLSPSPEPYVPSSDTGRLDLLSDTTSPTREEIRDVERVIFADDRILPIKKQDDSASQNSDPMLLETESLGDIYSPLKGIRDLPPSPSPFRQRPKDLKVDVPLSPPHSDQPPPWKRKSVSFSEALPELIPELPPPITKFEDTSSDEAGTFIEEAIKPLAVKAERAVEQEQLHEADTILRVPVPIMDFSLPIAPWKAKSRVTEAYDEDEALKKTLTEMKALHFSKHGWPTSGPAERELKWAPFPAALGKVETQESIPDNGFVEKYIVPPERVDVTTLTWKPDGLRIFDELAETDEDELEQGDFPEEKDINSLVRKRKLELEADELVSTPSEGDSSATHQSKQKADTTAIEVNRVAVKPVKNTASEITDQENCINNIFSTTGALEDYMNIRKGRMTRPKVTSDHHFAKISQLTQQSEPVDPHPPKSTSQNDQQVPLPRTVVLRSPVLPIPSSPRWFIISASFLSNRRLSRQVQRLYPSAEFIDRDFTLHQQQKSQERPLSKASATSMILGTMADEADMLLSAGTGLIWTSLQKIKQRSLPGQITRSAVRERITRTSPRYERLIVLVSQNRNTEPTSEYMCNDIHSLDDDDSTAFAEFTAFCSALPDEVQTFFVAGSEEDLAKWIVAVMVKHGMNTEQEIKLLQDETLWEVFLRRAGMNAFAAQAIIATLKAPDQNEVAAAGIQGTDFGLTLFAKMSIEERFAHFETLLGGRRLLERVSRILDARWIIAFETAECCAPLDRGGTDIRISMGAGLDTGDMTSLADDNHPPQPRLVGTTGDLYQGSIAETAIKEGPLFNYSSPSKSECSMRSHTQNECNHFKSAQWSPDGTTILTSSADNILRSFILPPDLLTPPYPRTLTPYTLHHSPEPVYATTFHPSYNLQEPSTCLALASPRSLPIRLFSPFTADKLLASYPLVRPTTEAWTAPYSLLFHPQDANTFFAGSESCVSVFDVSRDGDEPVTRMHTTPSRRGGAAGPGLEGMKGIVSALGVSAEGVLAAGTYSRWVGLYDGFGRGGDAGVFAVGAKDEDEAERGGGITQVIWSACGRYLCVVERASDGVGVWDIRGTGKRLAWLRGRNAKTQQRLSVEVMGGEVWAGGLDGIVRVWGGLGMVEGVMDPGWEFRAHEDAVSSTTLHATGSVLATCSGQRHSFHPLRTVDDLESESDSDCSSPSSLSSMASLSSTHSSSQMLPPATDNTLKLWAL